MANARGGRTVSPIAGALPDESALNAKFDNLSTGRLATREGVLSKAFDRGIPEKADILGNTARRSQNAHKG